MTAADPRYLAAVLDRIEAFVPVSTRRFFGGTGLLAGETQFAMVMGENVYLAVDATTRERYEAAGAEPFSYLTGRGEVTVRRYYRLPDHILDDPDTLPAWIDDAIHAAKTKASTHRRGKKPTR